MLFTKAVVGKRVKCPADRGDAPYTGTITQVGTEVHKNIKGVEYVWVTVKGSHHSSVWPSNRLN